MTKPTINHPDVVISVYKNHYEAASNRLDLEQLVKLVELHGYIVTQYYVNARSCSIVKFHMMEEK